MCRSFIKRTRGVGQSILKVELLRTSFTAKFA
jgi:hypothetical protein